MTFTSVKLAGIELVDTVHEPRHRRDDLIHIVCKCNIEVAKCGTDVSGEEWDPPFGSEDDCTECELLDRVICPICGG